MVPQACTRLRPERLGAKRPANRKNEQLHAWPSGGRRSHKQQEPVPVRGHRPGAWISI